MYIWTKHVFRSDLYLDLDLSNGEIVVERPEGSATVDATLDEPTLTDAELADAEEEMKEGEGKFDRNPNAHNVLISLTG